jgi:type I restriction enzyme R subunit
MSSAALGTVGQRERQTQNRVVALFRDRLGYTYGGNWDDRDNSNIDEGMLARYLIGRGYDQATATRAIALLTQTAALDAGGLLYDANRETYELLRYGVGVKLTQSEQTETVHLIDWDNPSANHFVVAEEVTIKGEHTKRPDVVLYVNGIALAVIELKRSTVDVSEGIRQNRGNQQQTFVQQFFTTVQLLFAGNDVQGLRYGVIGTEEKYWLTWKEPSSEPNPLDAALLQMCLKERLLELIHDFIVFDAGTKKTARHNQYCGVKAAQERVRSREGGIIWHTQGSGKSLTMVWLAKWLRESQPDARVLIVTDREELDEQIGGSRSAGGRQGVFAGVGESIHRTDSGADLIATLGASQPALICSLIHKFGTRRENSTDDNADRSAEFIRELRAKVPAGWAAKGNIFVFVDEAHRTQSGKLHSAMKALLPGAMFIGFTGTPLLAADKATSLQVFGRNIHTYKFDEAVGDGVVLDLRYEARNIDQELKGAARIDEWFDLKTRGLTDLSKARLKKRWGTMQKVVSARSRGEMIVQDILMDFEREPRLVSGRGNAMLVSADVYQACKFYESFVLAGFRGKLAIVTSYVPNPTSISKEDSGDGDNEELRKYDIYRQMLADYFGVPADDAVGRIEEFEADVKRRFVDEPGQMRLLIVVDKLLTGFDAPSATYLYIDKKMRDHGLFQAICRVNRLDGDDKTYGYVVDYRDLFKSIESAMSDYTSEAFDTFDKDDIEGLLQDRLATARGDLDKALERIRALCEPVKPPKGTVEFQHYFVSDFPGDADQIKANETKRIELYKATAALVRRYTAVANDMEAVGYTAAVTAAIKQEVGFYVAVRDEVELGAGEKLDMKRFEAGMRVLLDTYIQADPVDKVASFEQGLVQLIVELGVGAVDALPARLRANKGAVAETIINNVRRIIVDSRAMNPKYYDSMSRLLDDLIAQRNQAADDYEAYLARLLDLARRVGEGESPQGAYPPWATSRAQRALVDFFFAPDLGVEIDPQRIFVVIQQNKDHGWANDPTGMKERSLAQVLRKALPENYPDEDLRRLIGLLKEHDEYR